MAKEAGDMLPHSRFGCLVHGFSNLVVRFGIIVLLYGFRMLIAISSSVGPTSVPPTHVHA